MRINHFARLLLSAAALLLFHFLPATTQTQQFVPNYDESKVGSYTLPDPLVMNNGRKITSASQWRARRQEILKRYETHVYGRTPAAAKAARISFSETSRDPKALGGLATRKEVTVYLTGKKDGPKMFVLFYIPNARTQAAPVFLGLNFNGNQAISNDPGITLASSWLRDGKETGAVNNRATEKSRGTEASRWAVEMALKRGYAVATIYNGDLFPDHKDGLKESVIPYFYRNGQISQEADDWNALGAWAWGLSRAVDYIEKDKDLDAKRIALLGHSRLGKGALWAGAQDERFALVISNEGGEGGAALARRNYGETVERINTSFPYWFNANFKKYNKDVASLPVDQHMLLVLMAPRPLYVASAVEDQWADPLGEFLSAKAADPVYRLLKTDGLGVTEMPGLHQPVTTTIGHHIRAGKHDVTSYDWEQYLNFADKHLRRKTK